MPPEIIVAGHICLDIIPQISSETELTPGTLVNVGPAAIATGGAVANTGLALRKLDVSTRLIAKIGADAFGRVIAESTTPDDCLIVDPTDSSSYTVVISRPGQDRTFMHCPGANDRFNPSEISDFHLAGAAVLHFGYPPLMRSIYADGGHSLAHLFRRARQLGIITSLDMSLPDPDSDAGKVNWFDFLTNVLPFTDCFCPSFDEISYMLPDAQQVQDASLSLGAGLVMTKHGASGITIKTGGTFPIQEWRNQEYAQPVFPVTVVGTTGSGDATIAGLLRALVRGYDLPRAARSAVAVGAACCEAADAISGIPVWTELSARFDLES